LAWESADAGTWKGVAFVVLDLDDQVDFIGICDFDQMAHQVGQQLDLAFGLLQDLDQEVL
jgi:hypothetical protein